MRMVMPNPIGKLIFLDFDGVLHPITANSTRYSRVEFLARAISGFEDKVRLVITSESRNSYSIDELRTVLPTPLGGLVIGVTPVCSGPHRRFKEINAYLKQYETCADWRALDDGPLGFPARCPQLILCDPFVGLDENSAGEVRCWLAEGVVAA